MTDNRTRNLFGPSIFLGAESFSPGSGGICRVARLMARVLTEKQRAGNVKVNVLAFSDATSASDLDIPVATSRGSRARFVYEVHHAAFTHSHFIYDFLGMARAHCRVPLLRRLFMTWMHGIEVWENARPDRIRWARRADFLLANTAYTRERAEHLHGGFERAKVCWLATETDDLPTTPRKGDGPPIVLTVARLDEGGGYKGHKELIDCWPTVCSSVPNARLVCIGTGPGLTFLQAKAAGSRSAENIEFRGFVSEERIDMVWANGTVFAMPSRGEGFGLVYIEAMRHALPVIGSIHDAAPEINVEAETGYNVNLEKPDQLPERLIFLLKNPDQAVALGQNGQRRWAEHFRYRAFRARFVPLLQEFLAG